LQERERTYFYYLCFSALPTLWNAAAGGFFTGRGESRTVLLANGTGLLVNVVLCFGLVTGRWGWPALGIAGAGLATVAGSSVSAALALGLLLRPRYRSLGMRTGWRWDAGLLRRLLRFGVPNGLLVGLDTAAFAVFIAFVGRLGEIELAATSVAFTLNLFVYLPTMGIGQAVGVLVGQRLGAEQPGRAASACRAGLVLALAMTAPVGLVYLLLPDPLADLFRSRNDEEQWRQVAALVPSLLRFVVIYCLFDAVNLVVSHALRGAGDTRFVTVVSTALAWPVMVAPTWLARCCGWGLHAAWAFASLYIVVLSLVFSHRYCQGRWRELRVIEPLRRIGAIVNCLQQFERESRSSPTNSAEEAKRKGAGRVGSETIRLG
jgi:MATE family multidrug resistance protein